MKSDIPVQVDGEPWIQSPGQIVVLRSALKATMLKKRKRRKVNRRHTEPGLGASSGVAGESGPGSGVIVQPPLATTIPGVSESSNATTASTSSTNTTAPSVGGLYSSSGGSGGMSSSGKSRRALTVLRSEAAIGASQYTLHSQVAIPSERRPVTPTPYILHDFTLEDRFVDCGSGPELAPRNNRFRGTTVSAAAAAASTRVVTASAPSVDSSSAGPSSSSSTSASAPSSTTSSESCSAAASPDFLLNLSPPEE
ncbi:unnamed protein product [Hymenolepis diminuta]|uniref:Diacylglycerol kinase accessory domain-containing protein n=2 Tax=Hymenolepis diminuta TaxID=6216 RepID=A0A3P6XW06_HYMDI|nr:unnamed protein product [Hymenolepis diminuta]